MNRKRAMELCAIFFALMLAFTLLSRGADSLTVARVWVKQPGKQRITHQVDGSGTVNGTGERAVFMESGQRIAQVHVRQGSRVKKGDPLLTVERSTLNEQLEALEREEKAQKLQNGDLLSQEQVKEQQREAGLRRAREDYERAVGEGDAAVAAAQEEADIARARLADALEGSRGFQNEATAGEAGEAITALQDDLRAKEQALMTAAREREERLSEAERQIEDAEMAEAADSSLEAGKLALAGKKAERAGLQELDLNEGRVCAPIDGVVTGILLKAGDVSGEGAALLLTPLEAPLVYTAPISEEEEKYVNPGSAIVLKGSKEIDKRKDLTVESIRTATDEKGMTGRELVVLLPEGAGEIGQSLDFTVTQEGSVYDCGVPIQALRMENSQYFLYVLEERSGILGEELCTRKVRVTVEDRNESYAALSPGAVSGQERVIVQSDRAVEDGSRVRLAEYGD